MPPLKLVPVVVASLLLACGTARPAVSHYRLAVPAQRVEASPRTRDAVTAGPPALMVEEFTVDTAYDDPRIVYRTSPYKLDYYHYHRWSAPPGRLVSEALRAAYARTGVFERVEPAWTSGIAVVLGGRVLALEEVDETEDRWIGHLQLELELRDAETEAPLWRYRADLFEPLDQRNPEALAEAVSEALARVVAETTDAIAARAAGTRRVEAGAQPPDLQAM